MNLKITEYDPGFKSCQVHLKLMHIKPIQIPNGFLKFKPHTHPTVVFTQHKDFEIF